MSNLSKSPKEKISFAWRLFGLVLFLIGLVVFAIFAFKENQSLFDDFGVIVSYVFIILGLFLIAASNKTPIHKLILGLWRRK